jgi:hypothetical protein
MAERNETQDWLDALAGKPNPNADSAVVRKASSLRDAIQRHDNQLMGNDFDIEAELKRLNTRLSKEGLFEKNSTSKSFSKRWAAFIAALLSAFAFGAITMRFAMMPAMEGVRSEGTVLSMEGQKKFVQNVLVSVADPSETMKTAVAEASRLGINFSVKVAGDGYDVVLEGLVPNSAAQDSIKQVFGISRSAAGDLQFQIRQKPRN